PRRQDVDELDARHYSLDPISVISWFSLIIILLQNSIQAKTSLADIFDSLHHHCAHNTTCCAVTESMVLSGSLLHGVCGGRTRVVRRNFPPSNSKHRIERKDYPNHHPTNSRVCIDK